MKAKRFFVAIVFLTMVCVSNASGQVEDSPNIAGTPPKMLLLVHQEFKFGKAGERQRLEVAISRACDHPHVQSHRLKLYLDSAKSPTSAKNSDVP
jgi:hypothetical protein